MNDISSLNTSFSSKLPTLQLALDSVSIGALKTCPAYYNFSVRLGYTTHSENVHLSFGIYFHRGVEHYNRQRAAGVAHDPAIVFAIKRMLIETWDFKHKRPWTSDDPMKNRETLIRALIWYFDQFRDDPLQTYIRKDGKPALELSFSVGSGIESYSTKEEFLLCGHIDKVSWYQDRIWISDHKTTKSQLNPSYFERYSPDNQISLYCFAGTIIFTEPVGGIFIDAAQTLVNGNRFQRQQISRSPAQLEEWYQDLKYWVRQLEYFATTNHWPQNDRACGIPRENPITGETEYGCPYRGICGTDPKVRDHLLKQLYVKRVWDPLKTRET